MIFADLEEDVGPEAALEARLGNRFWRLNNLYTIVDSQGRSVRFTMNWVQLQTYYRIHNRNLILKSRQHGMSTFIDVFMLDMCLFNSNTTCAIVADNLDNAKNLMATKVRYPYDHLDPRIKEAIPLTRDNVMELTWERPEGPSSIYVDTSLRSGTAQVVHISEFGKICSERPDRAREIVTGCFNAVDPTQTIFVESTAEGREGYFYDYCETAKAHEIRVKRGDSRLTELDFRFLFFPWWRKPTNRLSDLDTAATVINGRLNTYFDGLEVKEGIRLTPNQKAWYAKMEETQQDDMKREHPSTPEEAFEKQLEGAYYKSQFTFLRRHGRLASVPHVTGVAVDTWWDIGYDDETAIWFSQDVGKEVHLIDYHESSGEGLEYYVGILRHWETEKGYLYGAHTGPHDLQHHDFATGKTVIEMAKALGVRFEVAPQLAVVDGINAVRRLLSVCWIDEVNCDEGIKALEGYRKEWDEKHGTFKSRPLHNWASHGADALRTMGVAHRMGRRRTMTPEEVKARRDRSRQARKAHFS